MTDKLTEILEELFPYAYFNALPEANFEEYRKRVAQARQKIISLVPASNRKSCKIKEVYMQRFKEGFNACRQQILVNFGEGK